MLLSSTLFISLVLHFGINIKIRNHTSQYSVNPALGNMLSIQLNTISKCDAWDKTLPGLRD